ncbi:MAG: aminotransferase class IV [Oscillospiraceae bacterium]|jgi:D-alanine transaminase|nr:aminotransferase class IV [Oscillospiraceae bacterium]
MASLAYYNGKIGDPAEIKIPMLDRAVYFGDGVYDAARVYKGTVIDSSAHIDRFYNSAHALEIELGLGKAEFLELLLSLVRRLGGESLFIYWQASRGIAPRDHTFPPGGVRPSLLITLGEADFPDIYRRVSLITAEDTRYTLCNIKTLNLIPNVLASERAKRAGCQEAVFHRDGRVTECAHSNVHILKGGTFRTAPLDNWILPGTARANLIKICGALGIPVDESPFTLDDLFSADEAIVSNCGCLCAAADYIDGKPVGGKSPELLRRLQEATLRDWLAQAETT